MKVLVDMNLSPRWAAALRAADLESELFTDWLELDLPLPIAAGEVGGVS